MIGHASQDENKKLKGGNAGDQTGKEVYTREWYNRPWNVVLRPKSTAVGKKIAKAMKMACNNNNIGYDQNQRNTVLTQARKHDYDLSKINVKCECDCSSLVSVCCMYAGVPEDALYKNKNNATTSTLRARLLATGLFTAIEEEKYLSSDKYLKEGDILLYEGHHVAVNLTDGSKVSKSYLEKGDKGDEVATMQKMLIACGYSCGSKGADGSFGDSTERALKAFQKAKGLTVDGKYGSKSKSALAQAYNDVKSYYKKYTGKSMLIDTVFKDIGAPYGSKAKRKPVAVKNGYANYKGSLSQNLALIKLAKNGKLKK